jgi:transposase
MAGPSAQSACSLADEVGVCQSTLSRWKREACSSGSMAKKKMKRTKTSRGEAIGRGVRPQDWTAEERVRVVLASAGLPEEALGAFLRREGLHSAQLAQWRDEVAEMAVTGLKGDRKRTKKSAHTKRIRELEKEIRRKDKALAEAAALLVLKKKAQTLWGDDEGDDT